jgi:hypothetical protein
VQIYNKADGTQIRRKRQTVTTNDKNGRDSIFTKSHGQRVRDDFNFAQRGMLPVTSLPVGLMHEIEGYLQRQKINPRDKADIPVTVKSLLRLVMRNETNAEDKNRQIVENFIKPMMSAAPAAETEKAVAAITKRVTSYFTDTKRFRMAPDLTVASDKPTDNGNEFRAPHLVKPNGPDF